MVDIEKLHHYQPPTPVVESVQGNHLHVFCGDSLPSPGSALAVETGSGDTLFGVVQRHLGQRRADVWLPLAQDHVQPGDRVHSTDQPAGFLPPHKNQPVLAHPALLRPAQKDDILFWPTSPTMTELDGRRPALTTGIEPIDILAPFCRGGLNLIIDATDDEYSTAFHRLSNSVATELQATTTLITTHFNTPSADSWHIDSWQIDCGDNLSSHLVALQLTIALGDALRHRGPSLAIVQLPAITPGHDDRPANPDIAHAGIARIVEQLGHHLVSTHQGSLTTLLHLTLDARLTGLQHIIDTLNLGDVDARIHIDAQGRFAPQRSASRADLPHPRTTERRQQLLQTLSQARRAHEKSAIFGEHDLTDEERRALRRLDEMLTRI